MTEAELAIEREYLIQERLGILCGDKQPTILEQRIADEAAAMEIKRLQEQ